MTKNTLKAPRVRFINDPDSNASNYCFVAKLVLRKFYDHKFFTILPYPLPNHLQTVYLPDFNLPKKFWRLLKKTRRNAGELYPASLLDIVKPLLPAPLQIAEIDLSQFWQEILKLEYFSRTLSKIKQITVLISPFGPGASYNYHLRPDELFISFRSDRKISDLPRSIISCLVSYTVGESPSHDPQIFWKNRYYSEFFASETNLKKFCPPLPNHQLPPNVIKDSKQYLQKLGLERFKKITHLNLNRFSPQEKLVLSELISKKELNNDQIAKLLWGEDEDKFSLWAITKLIQKIRTKIKRYGGDPSQLKTVYGHGYGVDI